MRSGKIQVWENSTFALLVLLKFRPRDLNVVQRPTHSSAPDDLRLDEGPRCKRWREDEGEREPFCGGV
ncbi:hypothetical protein E2C01_071877 [Portunus trituberculatus]|uniref:Uncharacterized protein n=1 Tax=Portunus trituberculatus TaxID=210409 RepID=A0A5B7I9L8_PORTR|nr:hypothetical protein [Portunus trituberculatus]